MDLRTDDFDYVLPPERIAQTPVEPRDASRLLVIHRSTGELEHRVFREIGTYLRPGDLLVANDSRVLPGRLWARRSTGGRVELLLLRELEHGWWEALARPIHRLRPGERLHLVETPEADDLAGSRTTAAPASPKSQVPSSNSRSPDLGLGTSRLGTSDIEVGERTAAGGIRLRFLAPLQEIVARFGRVPLPPYIRAPLRDPERYQTVYARVTGSAAAPTAGLHFTPRLLDQLVAAGVRLAFVTLHVGPDTFRPVRAERVVEHEMHAEFATVPAAAAQAIVETKRAGRRVVAVGTTVVRALEAWADDAARGTPHEVGERATDDDSRPPAAGLSPLGWSGWTPLFIYPGYRFRVVDALITNFHLPRSTLLMLVSAFASRDLIRRAYEAAVAGEYRFYSFGDCCLIL